MIVLNEYELSAPIYIWEPLLYNNKNNIKLDIYYCENGFPKEEEFEWEEENYDYESW